MQRLATLTPGAFNAQAFGRDAATLALRAGSVDARLEAAEAHKARGRKSRRSAPHALDAHASGRLWLQVAGNSALRDGARDASAALLHYTRALALLLWFGTRPGRACVSHLRVR